MVDIEDFSNVCAKAAEAAYAVLPDLGEQDQFKIWARVAKQIPCSENIQITEHEIIEELAFDDLVLYYKNAAVQLKFEEMIESIKDEEKQLINLNEPEDDQFNDAMSNLCPSSSIEMNWHGEEENGNFNVNIDVCDIDIKNIATEIDDNLIAQLESAFAAKIDAKYYQIAKCQCGYMNLESESPYHRESYKNNTNYHTACGWPSGVLNYLMIVEHKSGSLEEQENQIQADEIPDSLKSGAVWEELKEIYGLEDSE